MRRAALTKTNRRTRTSRSREEEERRSESELDRRRRARVDYDRASGRRAGPCRLARQAGSSKVEESGGSEGRKERWFWAAGTEASKGEADSREDAWNKPAKGSQVRTPCRASELTRRPPTITSEIDQLGELVDAHRSVRTCVRRRPRRHQKPTHPSANPSTTFRRTRPKPNATTTSVVSADRID